ncbi:MAG: hypothetical protein AAB466_08015 [Verrucomicrobiota bacterium]
MLLRPGGRHDIYVNPATGKKQPVPCHTEVGQESHFSEVFRDFFIATTSSATPLSGHLTRNQNSERAGREFLTRACRTVT